MIWDERGRPGRSRTCNPRIRNPMLYPLELRAPDHQCVGEFSIAKTYGSASYMRTSNAKGYVQAGFTQK